MNAKKYNKAYKFRILPNKDQRALFAKNFGCTRFVYNYYLGMRKTAYETEKRSISNNTCSSDLTKLKSEKKWLKEVDSISLQQSLRHLDTSFKNFFRNKKSGYPKFKSKRNNKHSYSTCLVHANIQLRDGYLRLPKVGLVKIKQHRAIPSGFLLKSVTISQNPSGKYFASILYEYEKNIVPVKLINFVGLDYSMRELYIASDSSEVNYPRYYHLSLTRLKKQQRILSKMQKGSNNRSKQRIKVAKLHELVSNQRKDYLHKLSKQITNAYDAICIEDLDMQEMSQKLNFGKSVADNGWGIFTTYLAYKLQDQGKQLIKIGKWYPSSKICSHCGSLKETLELSKRTYLCDKCGMIMDRDANASINIKKEGMRLAFT